MFSKIKNEALRKFKIQPIPTKYEKSERTSRPLPSSRQYSIPPSCAARLTQDMMTLINDPQDSDVQFKIGSDSISTTRETGETNYDESAMVTIYAHSLILRCRSRYFSTILDEENLGESSKYIIYQPNASPSTFKNVLHYIYTGDVCAKRFQNIIELITAAEEMELEGLSIECQAKLLRKVQDILSDKRDGDEEEPIKQCIPIEVATRTYIIPALALANKHSFLNLSRKLLTIIIPHVPEIIESPNAYSTFIDNISSEDLVKVIESDNLAMNERSIWDLVLDWACHQIKLEKTAVEERLCNAEEDEEDEEDESDVDQELSDGKRIINSKLRQLKTILTSFLPTIRFSLLAPDEYAHIVHMIGYFLPRRQSVELQQYFMKSDRTKLGAPRLEKPRIIYSKIITNPTAWRFLRKNIFETGGIAGCSSSEDLKFMLLFRASDHGFLATTFHQRCDYRGHTFIVVKSSDGHLFGGINFSHWNSTLGYDPSQSNFLFALSDGHFRKKSEIFKLKDRSHEQYSIYNNPYQGPTFGGGYDLRIANNANASQDSYSNMPYSYYASGASNTSLAGAKNFMVLDYEVFAISKE